MTLTDVEGQSSEPLAVLAETEVESTVAVTGMEVVSSETVTVSWVVSSVALAVSEVEGMAALTGAGETSTELMN